VARGLLHRAPAPAWLLLVAAPLLLFVPALADRFPELRDSTLFTYPARAVWAERVMAGDLPEWNPSVGLGVPVLAAPVHGTLYPPNALLLLFDTPTALTALYALHLVLAGVGGLLLARRLGCRTEAALVAALICAVGGFAVSMIGNGDKVFTCAWVPWAALGLVATTQAPPGRWHRGVAGTAMAFAMIALAGDAFTWFQAGLVGVPLAVAASRWCWQTVGRLLAVAALALVLSAPALLPPLAFVGESDRSGGVRADEAAYWSTEPGDLVGLVVPGDERRGDPSSGRTYASSLYVGLAALAALAARRRRTTIALWGCVAVATTLALGSHTPVHELAREWVPPLAYMRYPEKHALAVVLALALLAAAGWERLLEAGEARWPDRVRRIAFLVPLVAAVDLTRAAMPLVDWTDAAALRSPPPLAAPLRSPEPGPTRVARSRNLGNSLATLAFNHGIQFGLAHVPGFDPVQSPRLARLWDTLSTDGVRAAQRLRIAYAVTPTPRGIDVLAIPGVPPRVVAVSRVHIADDPAGIARLASSGFDDLGEAVVAPGGPARALHGDGPAGTCRITRYDPEAVDVDCTLAREGLVVLADAHARGWSATLDGVTVPIVRANVVMRGVYVRPGQHRLGFRFRTPGRDVGFVLGLVGLLVVTGLLWRGRASATPRGAEPSGD
jgi:hypothetical protein